MSNYEPSFDDPTGYLYNVIYRKEKNYRHIRVPETIVYEHNFPRAWYYYEGEVLFKRTGKELNRHSVYDALTRRLPANVSDPVVAVYLCVPRRQGRSANQGPEPTDPEQPSLYKSKERERQLPHTQAAILALQSAATFGLGDDKFDIKFILKSQLNQFIFEGTKGERGVLQAFIHPRGKHNDVIKAIWTPGLCIVQRRLNRHEQYDPLHSLYERTITEKVQVGHVDEGQIASAATTEVQSLIQQMAADMKQLQNHHQQVHTLVLFLKINPRRVLHVLFSPLILVRDVVPLSRLQHEPCVQTHMNFRHDFELVPGQGVVQIPESQKPPDESGQSKQLQKIKNISNAPLNLQYQFFKSSLLPSGNNASPLLSTAATNTLACTHGITPKQSLLLQRFEKLVHSVEHPIQYSPLSRTWTPSRPSRSVQPSLTSNALKKVPPSPDEWSQNSAAFASPPGSDDSPCHSPGRVSPVHSPMHSPSRSRSPSPVRPSHGPRQASHLSSDQSSPRGSRFGSPSRAHPTPRGLRHKSLQRSRSGSPTFTRPQSTVGLRSSQMLHPSSPPASPPGASTPISPTQSATSRKGRSAAERPRTALARLQAQPFQDLVVSPLLVHFPGL